REYGLAVRRRSGEVRQVSLSVELITVQGELCTLTVARDVTERQQMEAALRESEARFRATFEQAAVGMAQASVDRRWLLVNQRLCEILGYPREELLTRTFHDLTHPEDLPTDLETVRRLLAGELSSYSLEKRYRRKDGTLVWVHLTVSLVEATPPYFIAVIEDITARKQMEEALVRQAEELRRSNDELQQFAYVASHDLQEPLRMVSTYVELLAKRYRGQLDADADEFIGYAVEGAQRMKALIDGLLAYSRVESQGRALQPTDSEAVFQRVLTDLQPAIAESGATITHEPLPAVRADAVQLGQVLQNLLSNALKFRGTAPPSIHVAAQRDGAFWRFAVRDNGIGIDPRYAQRIFQMFQRLHTRGKYPGTGIGLAICKRIIERHGGRIWVESEPGTGATFFFTLPAPTEGKPA
ncbi:MAG: PAS domain S-box protein, partial [Thermodesulfobacteriota bacterium]